MEITSLSQIISLDDYSNLPEAEQAEYNAAFAAFKTAHGKKYPEGQQITVPITDVNLLLDSKGFIRLGAKAGPNTYTPVFKYRPATLNIMFKNALQVTGGVALPILSRVLAKGALQMTVRVVDETDVYTKTADGITEELNFRGPGVARYGETQVEYLPSTEVKAEVNNVFRQIEAAEVAKMIAEMTGSTKVEPIAAATPATVIEDAEI